MRVKGTHCKSGRHLLEGNVYIYPDGKRACKICKLEQDEEYRKHRKVLKRIESFIKEKRIVRAGVWKASELKRLKQSIDRCYGAEILADQNRTVIKATVANNDQAEGRRLSA